MMMAAAVRSENLRKRFGGKPALDGLDAYIPAGRVTGVLGPNGAGKSTFFRMIAGLIRPDHGRLEVLGSEPGWRTNREIAYLPDRARWYRHHTVERALQWAEHLLPGFNRERAEQLLALMGLDPDMKAAGMSRGEEARLMLTLCVARDVAMIVLDEPFAGIDVVSRERIVSALIDNMSDRRQTMLISTHEIDEAESLFDHVVFIERGRLKMAGEAEALRVEHGSMENLYRKLYR